MVKQVLELIKTSSMIKEKDKVIVGVSGGPDSMCLLNLLMGFKTIMDFQVVVAHINHCLRGPESDGDEAFIKGYCENNKLEFYSTRVDINRIRQEKGISLELAGREARYNFFNKLFLEIKGDKIALAHNANDQAETVLMRIIRGSGLEGLGGIKPVRNGIYIRPLINTSREEIEIYLKDRKINYRTDKSNFDSIYTRNKIRLELIPLIKENYNSQIVHSLCSMSEILRADEDYLTSVAKKNYINYCEKKCDRVIIKKEAFLEERAILVRIVRMALSELTGSTNNFERLHIENIIEVQKPPTGRNTILTNNIIAINNYGAITLTFNKNMTEPAKDIEYKLSMGYNPAIKAEIKLLHFDQNIDLKSNKFIQYFDYDKIKGDITARYRKNGDSFTPFGMKGNKKLKDLFIDLKITKEERDKVLLICFNNSIGWIVGIRTAENFKIDNKTRNILQIKFEGEET